MSAVLGLVLYCIALIDWISDIKTGVYAHNHEEAFWETFALLLYTFFAIRFVIRKTELF